MLLIISKSKKNCFGFCGVFSFQIDLSAHLSTTNRGSLSTVSTQLTSTAFV
jgi:hypothetical protein